MSDLRGRGEETRRLLKFRTDVSSSDSPALRALFIYSYLSYVSVCRFVAGRAASCFSGNSKAVVSFRDTVETVD